MAADDSTEMMVDPASNSSGGFMDNSNDDHRMMEDAIGRGGGGCGKGPASCGAVG